jgi:hypothetical protein
MKRLSLILTATLAGHALLAQNPVHWNFFTKKVAGKMYEIHLVADIDPAWHIYSQSQPADAIAAPTKIRFHSNPLLQWKGGPKEIGKLEKYKNETLGVSANQYATKVEFVQQVVLKTSTKIKGTGEVVFQACTDQKCLPPATISFSVALP